MNELSTTTASSGVIFNTQMMNMTLSFAEEMAKSTVSIPNHLVGKKADCMAIVLVSLQWGMNPYQVAQQTSLINGVLAYGAQLVNAVVSSSTAIVGRFHYEYSDGWEKLAGKCKKEKNENNKWVEKAAWDKKDEEGLWVRVGAIPRGETEIVWSEKLYMASVLTRNSPLWVTDPAQQIGYLAVKRWARKYTPAVLLGVYTPDEVEEFEEKDITPKKSKNESALRLGPTATTSVEKAEVVQHEQAVKQVVETAIEAAVREQERQENLADILFAIKKAGTDSELQLVVKLIDDHLKLYADDRPELTAAYKTKATQLKNASFQGEL